MFNFTFLGGTSIKGHYKPNHKNTYATLVGGHDIDLRQADLPTDGPVKITICTLFGGAKVIVLPGTTVIVGGITVLGGKKVTVEPGDGPSGAHVKIKFNCLAGGLEVSSKSKDS